MDTTNYENRNLYEIPELTFKDITNFPKNYENYFNDHLPFKNEIRKTRSNILYNIFNISSSPRVIVGEDGWLFYNSRVAEGVDTISDYRNIIKYNKQEKENIKNSLLDTRDKLKENNINFYVLVTPNKENVYSDKLEKIIKRGNNSKSRTEDLIEYLKENSDLNIIYPKDQLINNRKINETYYKYDTHWNSYGAYLGVSELMKTIDTEFEIPEVAITKQKKSGDLARMNLIQNTTNNEPIINNFYDDINYECVEDVEFKKCNSNEALYDKTLLVVGDSFRESTIQFLSKIYKETIFIHRNYYKEDLIKKYDVNIVIYEAVERYSGTLMSTGILTSFD